MSSNFNFFQTSGGIWSRLAAFLLLIFFFSTTSSSFSIKCPSLMSNWLLMFLIGLSQTSGGLPGLFFQCSFHFCILYSWLAAFNFDLEMLLLLLTSFTIYHANHDCQSSTEFLIIYTNTYNLDIKNAVHSLHEFVEKIKECIFLRFTWMIAFISAIILITFQPLYSPTFFKCL